MPKSKAKFIALPVAYTVEEFVMAVEAAPNLLKMKEDAAQRALAERDARNRDLRRRGIDPNAGHLQLKGLFTL